MSAVPASKPRSPRAMGSRGEPKAVPRAVTALHEDRTWTQFRLLPYATSASNR